MRGTNSYSQEPNSNSMASPQWRSYRPNSAGLERSSSAMVTPCGSHSGMSMMNRWMSRRGIDVQGEEDHMSNDHGQVSPYVRAEVSKEVYGILRDNLPPALEAGTSQEELALIAESIERKLYATATSPLAYCSKFATLEFRITALATAVLIHSDRGRDREDDDDDDDRRRSGHQDQEVSDTCARLSAAARKSLVYCVMVLVSYEKRNLDGYNMHRRRKRTAAHMENDCEVGSAHSRGQNKGYSSKAMVDETYSRHAAECHRRIRELERKYPNCQFEQPTSPVDFDQSAGDDLQTITGEDSKVQPSPPSS